MLRGKLGKIQTEEEIRAFVEEHCSGSSTIKDHLSHILAKKEITFSSLLEKSNINKNYGYNLISGARKNPGRDKVIAICVGAEMTFQETQETLDIAKVGRLYYCDERDVRIAAAINSKIGSVTKLNLALAEHGLAPLDV